MKYDFKNKVAVITGASRGIGLAIARELHEKGTIVYDISRHFEANPEIKMTYTADVNDNASVEFILQKIAEDEGGIDIFINNAGFGIAGAVENASRDKIYSLVDTNLAAVINLSRLAVKYLKQRKGRIVNISSVGGFVPLPYQAVYSATKAGVDVFSRALATEVREYGMKVMCVMPGDVKTGFTAARVVENSQNDKKAQQAIEKAAKEEQKGMSADRVAAVVVKNLGKRNPPLKKTVGGTYKLIAFAVRLVPTKMLNWLVRKIYI